MLIRPATSKDLPSLGRLGAQLLRVHHGYDEERFMAPGDDPESGYAWFLGTQIARDDVVVLVAEDEGAIVGYVYAGLEPQSWKELREAAGFVHDILVTDAARRRGVASELLDAALAWLRDRGAPRALLWTAAPNQAAQRLFAGRGFRTTMLEMTLELGSPTEAADEA